MGRRVQGSSEAIAIVEFAVGLGMLAVLVFWSRAVLADEGNRLPKAWLARRLLAMAAFVATALLLVGISALLTDGIAGVGQNPIELERGGRAAHVGVPFRFATSHLDPSDTGLSRTAPLGSDAPWHPMEIPTDYDDTQFERSTAVVLAVLSLFTLVPWALVADVRSRRRRD